MLVSFWTSCAERARRLFDRMPPRLGGVTVVGILAALTALTGQQQTRFVEQKIFVQQADVVDRARVVDQDGVVEYRCSPLPVSVVRVEVTFSAPRFASLINAEGPCKANLITSLITWDLVFPVCYGLLLCSLFLWLERWRCFTADDTPLKVTRNLRRDAVVLAPILAGLLDIFGENIPLWFAGRAVASNPAAAASVVVKLLVLAGSTAALLKWMLVLLSAGGILVELLSGPRGAVLWRVRFSSLAVLLGGVPLLAIPQGPDILQRLFEGDFPIVRLFSAVPPLAFAALAVWYCARKLTELRLDADTSETPLAADGWFEFFGKNVPRLLGIVLVALVGLAFATAGQASGRYLGVGLAGFFAALLARRYFPKALAALGRPFVPPRWRGVAGFDERIGRLLLASATGVLVFWPHWLPWEGVDQFIPGPSDVANEWTLFYLRLAAFWCLILAWLFQMYARFRREARPTRLGALPPQPRLNLVDPFHVSRGLKWGIAVTALVSGAWLAAFTVAPVTVGRAIGPLWILSLATVNAVFIGSLSVWAGKCFRVPVVTIAIVLATLFSLWNDNHNVRVLESSTAAEIGQRLTVDAELSRWIADLVRDGSVDDVPVILVAGAGGGLRAAYWTAMSLAVLQDRAPAFGRHLFAFSGVSGGSLGGVLFAAIARDASGGTPIRCPVMAGEAQKPPEVSDIYSSCVRTFMSEDHLSPVLAKLVAPDFLQWFLPFPVSAFDRATALESSWEESYLRRFERDTFQQGLAAFARGTGAAMRIPVLMLNSTHVETGRRYVASTTVVAAARGSPDLQDTGDVLEILQKDIRLSTAIHNSARFTYISPAGHLDRADGVEHGRVVDGGYFENSGLASLREVFDRIKDSGANVAPYVLYLCNDPLTCNAPERSPGKDDTFESTAADELLSPVRALLKTRDARGSLARAMLRDLAGDRFLQLNVCNQPPPLPADSRSADKARDRVVSPPLGWLLSRLARDWMNASLTSGVAKKDGTCYERNAYVIDLLERALRPPA